MESAARRLQNKIESARLLFERLAAAGVGGGRPQALACELCALETRLALATGHLYLAALAGESARAAASSTFERIVAAEDFGGALDDLVGRCEDALRASGTPPRDSGAEAAGPPGRRGRREAKPRPAAPAGVASSAGALPARGWPCGRKARSEAPAIRLRPELQQLLDAYPRGAGGSSAGGAQPVDYAVCPVCGDRMTVDAARSELRCADPACGALSGLVGTVFDDAQFYCQEGQKAKSGTFNPNRHFLFWWAHVLALEPEDELGDKKDPDNLYGEKVLAEMRAIVVRDQKVLRLLDVCDVRDMLEELGRTDLNKNAALLMKKLTGVGPPSMPEAVAARAENLFTKATEIGERIRRADRVNRNYYPYYIYKILAHILPADDFEHRRVLYYVYIQGADTVVADDVDWEVICEALGPDEIRYVPTDRTEALKYRPL